MTAREKANYWLGLDLDQDFKENIQKLLAGPEKELEDAFYTDLEFGTGGMRGVMGVGSNRVNKYTFGMATQGLANYLKKVFPDKTCRVAIAYDCRNNSQHFARLVADILSANGIHVFLFKELRPTPQLSFAVRKLSCQSGIVITASHNPPEYNGYKVYWNDGAQIVAPHDKGIIDEVRKVLDPSTINFSGNKGLIELLGAEMDEAFFSASLAQRIPKTTNPNLKVVFTSLHGTGITIMPELLKRAGYHNVSLVAEQSVPDGNFSTVKSPNPEEREALEMALDLAEKTNADVVIGTDPDGDRIGMAVRNAKGEMMLLNGNQTGVILTDYLLKNLQLRGDEFIAYTIVSSELFGDVARGYGVDSEVCLTGFKHIANLIRTNEGTRKFVGGGEESYGFMIGDFVRDKDAFTPAILFCDWLGEVIAQGSNAESALTSIYRKHGIYQEDLVSITKRGKDGAREIKQMMANLRADPPKTLAGDDVVRVDDLQNGVSTDLITGHQHPIDLPSSNVLQFITKNGCKISARPSGTEPKIKFYFSVKKAWEENLALAEQQKILFETIERIKEDLSL